MSYLHKLTKVGQKSYAVVIPINIIKELGWKERQKVVVRQYGKKVIIQDWEPQHR